MTGSNVSMRQPPAWGASVAVAGTLVLALVGAMVLKPTLHEAAPHASLADGVPERFGDWRLVRPPYPQIKASVLHNGAASIDNPYDEVVMRSYVNRAGAVVMLALAYGKTQRQEVKIHRPELCYTSQGYEVLSLRPADFGAVPGASAAVAGKRMQVRSAYGVEAVSYWIRIGGLYSEDAVATRLHILSEGLHGRVPDGILVRASRLVANPREADAAHSDIESFLVELAAASSASARALLVR